MAARLLFLGEMRPRHIKGRRPIGSSDIGYFPPQEHGRRRVGAISRTLNTVASSRCRLVSVAKPSPSPSAVQLRQTRHARIGGPRSRPAPCTCDKCGGSRLRKLGEVVTSSLECEPRRWKVVEHVREKFSCRDCESITDGALASDRARARGPARHDPGF